SFFFSSRRRHTRCLSDWSSDVCSSDLNALHRDLARIAGVDKPPRHGEEKRGEQRRSVLDASRLQRATKSGKPVSLREGLERTWRSEERRVGKECRSGAVRAAEKTRVRT